MMAQVPIGTGTFKIVIGPEFTAAVFKRADIDLEDLKQIALAFSRRKPSRIPIVIVVTETGEL